MPFGAPGRPELAGANLLRDGEALLAGTEEESPAGRVLVLARFAASGRAEGAFRPFPLSPPGGGHYIGGAVLLGAGRGMIVGTTVRAARCPGAVPQRGAACHAIALRRYRLDGSLARGFGEDGTVVIPVTRLCRRSGSLEEACGLLPGRAEGQNRAPAGSGRSLRQGGARVGTPHAPPSSSPETLRADLRRRTHGTHGGADRRGDEEHPAPSGEDTRGLGRKRRRSRAVRDRLHGR